MGTDVEEKRARWTRTDFVTADFCLAGILRGGVGIRFGFFLMNSALTVESEGHPISRAIFL
jgi:hypothetical protein